MTRAKSAVAGLALFAAALVGAPGTAQAAVYTGNWDPLYGGSFSGLGWLGTATFFIPDACLASSGWIANSDSCSGNGMHIISAQVSFYDSLPSNIVETLVFDPNVAVYQMYVSGGQLGAVSSNFLGPVQGLSEVAGSGAYFFDLKFLQSLNTNVQLYHTPGNQDPLCAFIANTGCGFSVNVPRLVITPAIPEPSTVLLMLAGLGALGFAARRRMH